MPAKSTEPFPCLGLRAPKLLIKSCFSARSLIPKRIIALIKMDRKEAATQKVKWFAKKKKKSNLIWLISDLDFLIPKLKLGN